MSSLQCPGLHLSYILPVTFLPDRAIPAHEEQFFFFSHGPSDSLSSLVGNSKFVYKNNAPDALRVLQWHGMLAFAVHSVYSIFLFVFSAEICQYFCRCRQHQTVLSNPAGVPWSHFAPLPKLRACSAQFRGAVAVPVFPVAPSASSRQEGGAAAAGARPARTCHSWEVAVLGTQLG